MLYDQAQRANLSDRFRTWTPPPLFPGYRDRAGWARIDESVKRPFIEMAEAHLNYDWPALRMQHYLNIKRHGTMFQGWQAFCYRRSLMGVLLIAECMEGQGRFLDQIINGIYALCEETSWIQMLSIRDNDFALPDERDNHVDLCSVETTQLFAWINALLGDELDAECTRITKRMHDEVMRRVVRPYLDRDDYWWMGFLDIRINNWNPWCNMHMIQCAALMDFSPEIKAAVIEKACRSLDIYIDRYAKDGACDEGPGYWGAAGLGLGKCIELLRHVTGGAVDGSNIEKLKLIGAYYPKVHIHENWFVNYADGDAVLGFDPSVYRLGKLLNDPALIALGRFAKSPTPSLTSWFSVYNYLVGLFDAPERGSVPAVAPYIERAYFDVCEILVAREHAGSAEGFYLSAKGGNNLESHNHNDVGSFIAFLDGKPLLIDIGTEEYSVKTFSKDRFTIWYLQSQYHNCPTIAGEMQRDGGDYYATDARYETGADFDRISMELAHAYPADTAVDSWRRSVALYRGEDARIEVEDTYRGIAKPGVAYNFVVRARPSAAEGRIELDCGDGVRAALTYDAEALVATIEEIPLEESRLRGNWGEMIWRIVLSENQLVADATRTFVFRRA